MAATAGTCALAASLHPRPIPSHDGHGHIAALASRARRLPWADLLRRVFAVDVLRCDCGGRRNVVAFVADATRARSLLTTIGLPAEPATFAPTRDPPQAELIWQDPP